jgi:hypothetical protein
MMGAHFTAGSREPDAAFADAAARFFELLKTFGQPLQVAAQPPDWASMGSLLAGQFEQWLRSSPAAGASFATAAGFPGTPMAWPTGAVPPGPAAAQGAADPSAWELLMKLGQLHSQLAGHWSEIAQSSAQRFTARMSAAGGSAVTPERALALYETWVECAEEAYAVTVRKEDFCRLQAQLANTATALLLAQRRQAEVLARAWGLPTREEADAMQRQIRELKQQLEERLPERPVRRARRSRAAPGPKAAPPRARGSRSRRGPSKGRR